MTLKDYYGKGKANSTREKLLIMFCEHMKNCIGRCKKERQSILETQHVRKVHDLLDPQKKDETIESLLKDGGLEVWKQWV